VGSNTRRATLSARLTGRSRGAGLPTHFTPHSTRHTYASILLSEDGSLIKKEQLGHAAITITLTSTGTGSPASGRTPLSG